MSHCLEVSLFDGKIKIVLHAPIVGAGEEMSRNQARGVIGPAQFEAAD